MTISTIIVIVAVVTLYWYKNYFILYLIDKYFKCFEMIKLLCVAWMIQF